MPWENAPMNTYRIVYSDREGVQHTYYIDAPNAREAQRTLYRQLGVKRLVGVNVQPV